MAELYLIRRRWTRKKITNFEIILMNLAIADLLVAVGMLAASSYGMALSETKLNSVMSLIIVLVLILGVVSSIFYVVSFPKFSYLYRRKREVLIGVSSDTKLNSVMSMIIVMGRILGVEFMQYSCKANKLS